MASRPYPARTEANTNLTGNLSALPNTGRRARRPQHRFQLRTQPWQIQPMLIAPVLPGETMTNLLVQARVVTDPIQNSLIGWWHEYHFFYVRLSDLDDFDATIVPALLNPTLNMSALNEASSVPYYHYGSAPNWTKKCLKRVTEVFFREQTADGLTQVEAWTDGTLNGLPAAKIGLESGLNSLNTKTNFDTENNTGQVDVSLDVNADGTIEWSEFERQKWYIEYLRGLEQSSSSYENFIAQYGVKAPVEERPDLRRPEWIRSIREWSYPSNTINPSDGSAASAVSWAIADRADKKRFFKEPGFLFGVQVSRPKVYLSKQTGSLVGVMNDALSWLPAALNRQPLLSFKEFAALGGPVPTLASAYVLDVRDLLIYGDQYVNFALTATDGGLVSMPTTGLETRYPTTTDADALFKVSTSNKIKADGIVHLSVQGAQVDSSAAK